MNFLSTPYDIFEDQDFRKRVLVAALLQGSPAGQLEFFYAVNGLSIAAKTDIVAAYEFAKQGNPYHSRLGLDPGIITDGMITAAVEEALAKESGAING